MSARHRFHRRPPPDAGSVTVSADLSTDTAVLTVRGTWDRALSRDTFLALRKCLSEHPAGVVLDLLLLADPHAASVSAWFTARRVGEAMDPPVQVTAAVAAGSVLADRLRRLGAARHLQIHDSLALARAALATRLPPADRLLRRLPADPDTPALARNLVTEACAAWRLPAVLHPARLVMSELAANGVEHGGGPIVVVVARRVDALHLVVADRDPRLPRLVELAEAPPARLWETRGQGLRTVRAASAAWGAVPTAEGKLVWATVRPR